MPSYRPLAVNQGIEAGRFLGKAPFLVFWDTGGVALKEAQQLVEEHFEKHCKNTSHKYQNNTRIRLISIHFLPTWKKFFSARE